MSNQQELFYMTKRQMDILNILWDSEEALTASEIADKDTSLTINTVQANLRILLKKEFIKVADITYSGTVLCRKYLTTLTKEVFSARQFAYEFRKFNKERKISMENLVISLLEEEPSDEIRLREIQIIQDMIKEYKEKIKE